MCKRILVTGSNGQLGNEIKKISINSDYEYLFYDVDELDITDINLVDQFFTKQKIDIVINCAAYTAVDKAENNKEEAFKINASAARNLALISQRFGLKLIHISTDFVFDGTSSKPYTEKCDTIPINVYGKSKLEGEKLIQKITDNYIIFRTSWLYSAFGNNFVKTIIKLAKERNELNVIYDQIGTPTYAADLACSILDAIKNNAEPGIYHYSNEGVASWYDFAKEIVAKANIDCEILPIITEDYPTPARRPHYSVLDKNKIKKALYMRIPHWKDSLHTSINNLN